MNLLYFAALCGVCCSFLVYLNNQAPKERTEVVSIQKSPTKNVVTSSEVVKLNKVDEFKSNVKCILSKAFFTQNDAQSAQLAVSNCIDDLDRIIEESDAPRDYILAYRAIASFLHNIKEKEAYAEYIKMIDTTAEINNISEAFSWLAAAMTKSRAEGFSEESIKNSIKQNNVLDHLSLLVNKNIFPHLYKRQRDFLIPVISICENTLISTGINNEPGPDDGPDIYANVMHMGFADAKEFDNKIKGLREFAEAIADRIETDNDTVLNSNIEKLKEYMERVCILKVELRENLTIKPTRTMVYELVALCDNTIQKIKNELEQRKNKTATSASNELAAGG